MNRRLLLLSSVVFAIMGSQASAGVLFNRQPKPNPKERVPHLVSVLKSEKDEQIRTAAAEELREYDAKAFPEIIPALVDAVQNDSKPVVRAEAAQSLGKLRPVSQEAGMALEQAAANDSSMRVRLQARSSLWSYHFAGYKSQLKREEISLQPLTETAQQPQTSSSRWSLLSRIRPSKNQPAKLDPQTGETPPPPLADPLPLTIPASKIVVPKTPSRPTNKPIPLPEDQGPILIPPPSN